MSLKDFKTIEVPCVHCGGLGFCSQVGENSVSSVHCPHCGGRGTVVRQKTVGDIIRECNDKELAILLTNLLNTAIYSGPPVRILSPDFNDCSEYYEWTSKPVSDLEMQTIFSFIEENE